MKKIVSLDEAREEDKVGSKAASLAAVSETSKVPQGFVVTDDAFKDFLDRNGIGDKILSILARTKIEDRRDLKDASRKIRNLFDDVTISEELREEVEEAYKNFVMSFEAKKAGRKAMELIKAGRDTPPAAVRSSPMRDEGSSPSIYKSSLNIKGDDNLVEEIKDVWKSFYSPEAIYYREDRGYPHDMPFAVLVQKMITPEKTFAYLQRDPCNSERSVLEGVYGFGNPMFSGEVTPDIYFFDKNGSLLKKRITKREWMQDRNPSTGDIEKQPSPSARKSKPVLERRETEEVISKINRISSRFGSGVMIEFCMKNGDIFILDVTTLERSSSRHTEASDDEVISQGFGVSPGEASGEVTRSERSAEDKILVNNRPSPFEIIFRSPKAVLTSSGGFSSNYSKISRELEVPCVVLEESESSSIREDEKVRVNASSGTVFSQVTEGRSSKSSWREDSWENQGKDVSKESDLMAENIDSITATELMVFTDSDNFEPDKFGVSEGCVVVVKNSGGATSGFGISRGPNLTEKLSRYPSSKELWLKSDGSSESMQRLSEVVGTEENTGSRKNVLLTSPSIDEFENTVKELGISDRTGTGLVVDTPEKLLCLDNMRSSTADFFVLDFESLVELFFGEKNRAKVLSSSAFWASLKEFCRACKEGGSKVAVAYVSDKRFLGKLIDNGVDTVIVSPEKVKEVKNTVARIEKKLLLERMR
ncbi:MAG: PEP/pyruvate-binding domain-containing protein [Candidatus Aenigmatarchaeota archaeon]